MNMALEWLLMTKATMDSHQRELVLNTNISTCQNEAQATEAIKEAEMCQKEAEAHCAAVIKETEAHHAIHACALEQSHKESMLELECEATAEEEHDCQAFMKACRTILACPPKAHGVLMYPLQLLTLQPGTVGRELTSTASPPTVSEMPAPPTGTKWQLSGKQPHQDKKLQS